MEIRSFEEFREFCKKATLKHFGDWRKEEEGKRSEKAEKIRKIIIGGGFECRTTTVLKLISEVIGENLGKADSEYNGRFFPIPNEPGVVFFLANNPNGHDYSLSEPSIYLKSDNKGGFALKLDGSVGNYLPAGKSYYPPTEKEFEDAMRCLARSEMVYCKAQNLLSAMEWATPFAPFIQKELL